MKIPALAFLALFLATPSYALTDPEEYPDAKSDYPFLVKIRSWDLLTERVIEHYLDKTKLVVVLEFTTDYQSLKKTRKEVFSRRLTSDEAKDWARYLENLPINQLKKRSYHHSGKDDGLRQYFTFRLGSEEKNFIFTNAKFNDFQHLIEKLNSLLGDRFRELGAPYCFRCAWHDSLE